MAELSRLGRYELRRVLGKGAMGVVYEGFDPTLNRRVAVKTILKSVALDEETARAYSERFVREAKAVGRLNHPHIVQVHDFGEHNEVAYLVMEFIEGRELRAFFDAGEKFDAAESVRIMGELLDALEFAHEAGVIHRDIKPANVMLDGQRRVKLADFGVARVQDGAEQSKAGTMVGTPAFMSPEQISGGKIDRRTDIFSAGTILYQLLTGEQPFKGEGAWTVAKMIMQDDPPLPSSLVVSVSPVFDDIVHKALAKSPAQRFASAKEFAAALRGALGGVRMVAPVEVPKPKTKTEAKASEAEVEFWRSIQNSTDPDELEFYLEQFPDGTYSQLARHKIAKLREPQEAARKEAEEKARLEAEERARREAEERAKREAAEKAKREAEAKAKREAEEKARREAVAKAKREAEEKARREAEAKAKREAEEKAKREAEAKARREAEEKARREAQEKVRREAEEKARQAQALARLKQQEEAAARAAKAAVDEDATVAIGRLAAPPLAEERKKSPAVPAVIAAVVIAGGIAAYMIFGRTPAPAPVVTAPLPVVEKPAPLKPEAPVVDIEKIKRETEERIRREYADKSAAEQAVAAKAAAEKVVAERVAAAKALAEKAAGGKAAAEKAVAEKAAAEKAAAGRAAAEKVAAERAAAEKAAAERAAAEKAAAEKAAVEKAAAEKAVAEKAAAEKAAAAKAAAAAAKPGWPSPGDRWIYEARDPNRPERRYEISVEVQSVGGSGVHDFFRSGAGPAFGYGHKPGAYIVGGGPGIAIFSPYLRAFQEIREGQSWSNVEFERFGGCSSNPQLVCSISARVAGREKVTVKAGTFDAWKIVVENSIRTPGPRRLYEYTYWYADEARRYVKFQGRARAAGGGPVPEMDMELLSYTPAGSK